MVLVCWEWADAEPIPKVTVGSICRLQLVRIEGRSEEEIISQLAGRNIVGLAFVRGEDRPWIDEELLWHLWDIAQSRIGDAAEAGDAGHL